MHIEWKPDPGDFEGTVTGLFTASGAEVLSHCTEQDEVMSSSPNSGRRLMLKRSTASSVAVSETLGEAGDHAISCDE